MRGKTVSFHTLGCRLNFSESGTLAQGFVDRGYEIVDFGQEADVTFLNTCTVTDKADSTCRNLIRKAKKYSPQGKVAVVGCYAQMAPDEIARMDADLILGTSEKYKIFDYLESEDENIVHIERSHDFWGATSTLADDGHTRAFVKIQDGCNYVCSYCIIPYARGRSVILSPEKVVAEVDKVLGLGYKEIVLTGVNIGEYEQLEELLLALTSKKESFRLRLSSIEPNTITQEILCLLKDSPHFMPHFHLPLQSGSDEILKAMKRKYDRAFYEKTVGMVKEFFPKASIGADVILGFPGESEEQFKESYEFIKQVGITHLHVFPFSKRKGTVAAKLPGQIPFSLKKERVALVNELREQKLQELAQHSVGEIYPVLMEAPKEGGYFEGYTPHYVRMRVDGKGADLRNTIVFAKATHFEKDLLLGEIV